MSVCPHTDNADKCGCFPGCGCDRDPAVPDVLREATAAAIENALRNCGAYTGTAYEDGSFCFDGDVDPKDLADAVLAALQLTEEWRVTEDGEQVAWPPDMKAARHVVEHPIGDAEPVIEVRFVGPWRATPSGEEL